MTTAFHQAKKLLLLLTLLALFAPATARKSGGSFTTGNQTFLLNGKPFVVKAAELHYPRIPRPYWEHRIQMCRALGMNTICLYVFWNIHEPQQDAFDFTGQNDVAEFCRLAQKNGMYVIVRPGPYVCAEWEMGGLPWWLLKKKDIRLREQDPFFMQRVRTFEQKVGEQLAPLTIQHGGPIIMVQVENEYGSYGEDKAYVGEIRDCLRDIYGSELLLFQCDWSSNFQKNGLDDLPWTMNFGTGADIDQQFSRLRQLRPQTPLMCSEFWSGWFDKWGARHETRPADKMVAGIDEMLTKGISFSLYMTHGGTSFGHWAGANSPGFQPDVTSYDYDAPINEWGLPTDKYWQLREVMQRHAQGRLPDPPKPAADIIAVPEFRLDDFAPVLSSIAGIHAGAPQTFEDMDMGHGMMYYLFDAPQTSQPGRLTVGGLHDFARVFLNGHEVGTIDRRKNQDGVDLPPLGKQSRISLLVEAMGRINFGRAINDPKGITGDITLSWRDDRCAYTWSPYNAVMSAAIPDTPTQIRQAYRWAKQKDVSPDSVLRLGNIPEEALPTEGHDMDRAGYYGGHFNLQKVGDTFLNMEHFGKGQVWVNGHALGRYWNIGPQQTLYLPGCWLKKGRNEVVVLDMFGPDSEPVCSGQTTPELNKLGEQRRRNRPATYSLDAFRQVASGELNDGNGWQTIALGSNVAARRIAIVCESAHDGGAQAAIAELHLQDPKGNRLSREQWTVAYTDSEDTQSGNLTADKVFDLQESTYWQTAKGDPFPHSIVIDLGAQHTISALELLPRAEHGAPASVRAYKVYVY